METAMATLILLFGLGSGHNCLVGSQLVRAAFCETGPRRVPA
jgi:hypothetical protein